MRRGRSPEKIYNAGDVCVICFDNKADTALSPCHHSICSKCTAEYAKRTIDIMEGRVQCPSCRCTLTGIRKMTPEEILQQKQLAEAIAGDTSPIKSTQEELRQNLEPPPFAAAPAPPVRPVTQPRPEDFNPACRVCNLALTRRVSESQKNPGRAYFGCSSFGCPKRGFGCWASASGGSNSGVPHCSCNKPCNVLVSRTEKNPGRHFFTCSERKCIDFFFWANPKMPS